MFTKYIGQFGKAEAEWVLEIIDMCDGDEPKAKAMVLDTVARIIERTRIGAELATFDKLIDACCRANPMWWPAGLVVLRNIGRVK